MTTTPLSLNFDTHVYDEDSVDLYALARLLRVSLPSLGDLTGLPARVIYDPEARTTPTVQARLRDLVEILEIVMAKVDSVDALVGTMARYRISSLSGYTIRELFHAGNSRDVLRVLRSAAFPMRSSTGGRFDVPVAA